jgi:hypothetical protein
MSHRRQKFGEGSEGHVLSATIADGVVTSVTSTPTATIGAAGVDVVSAPIDLRELDTIAFQLITVTTTDNVAGAWSIEWSNNYSEGGIPGQGQRANAGDWSTETAVASPAPADGAQDDMVTFQFIGARHGRIRFTPSGGAGDGTVNVWVFCKGA